jgi:hypothetical protein
MDDYALVDPIYSIAHAIQGRGRMGDVSLTEAVQGIADALARIANVMERQLDDKE